MSPIEFLPLVVIAVLFWFFLIRPQTKRARELRDLQRSLEVGDEVVLTSGFFATVTGVADDHVMVELTEGVTVKVARAAIGMLSAPAEVDPEPELTSDHPTSDTDTSGTDDDTPHRAGPTEPAPKES